MNNLQPQVKVVKNYDITSYPPILTVKTMDRVYTFTLKEMRLKDIRRDQKDKQVRVCGTKTKAVREKRLSIKAEGILTPLVVDSTGYLFEGYTRYSAIDELGWITVPVYVLNDCRPSGAKLKRLQVTLNKKKGSIQGNSEQDILSVGKASLLEDWQCLSDEKRFENVTILVNDSLPQNTTQSRKKLIRQIFNEVGQADTYTKIDGYSMAAAQEWLVNRGLREYDTFIKDGKFKNLKYCRETNSIPCVFAAETTSKFFALLFQKLLELESGKNKIPQKDIKSLTVHFVGFSDKNTPTDILNQREEKIKQLTRYIDSSLHSISRKNFEEIKFVPQIMNGPKKENQHSLISYPLADEEN